MIVTLTRVVILWVTNPFLIEENLYTQVSSRFLLNRCFILLYWRRRGNSGRSNVLRLSMTGQTSHLRLYRDLTQVVLDVVMNVPRLEVIRVFWLSFIHYLLRVLMIVYFRHYPLLRQDYDWVDGQLDKRVLVVPIILMVFLMVNSVKNQTLEKRKDIFTKERTTVNRQPG